MLDDFIALSLVLTGEGSLDRNLAEQYLQRILRAPIGTHLPALLRVFRAIQEAGGDVTEEVKRQIVEDAALGPVAKDIIILWYLSDLKDDGQKLIPGPPEQFFQGLVWSVIRAHPPALSGGYFGYWKYPPEN